MKWWLKRGTVIQGPFGEDEIRYRIRTGQIGSLDRVSTDKCTWMAVRDSGLWRSSSPSLASMEKPSQIRVSRLKAPASDHVTAPISSDPLINTIPNNVQPKKRKFSSRIAIAAIVALSVAGGMFFIIKNGSNSSVKGEFSSKKLWNQVLLINDEHGGSGTGFLLDMDGKTYLVSNEHVLRNENRPLVRFVDGRELRLGAFSVAKDRDLARFEVIDCPEIPLRLDIAIPNVNDKIAIYGNSMGRDVITETTGVIKGVGPKKLETDAGAVVGNSGSPMINNKGWVLGVFSFLQKSDDSKNNWTLKDTRFDGAVQRFGVRLTGVEWIRVDREQFEEQVAMLNTFEYFLDCLWAFLSWRQILDAGEVIPPYSSTDSEYFINDTTGFDELLQELSDTYQEMIEVFPKCVSHEEYEKFVVKVNNDPELTPERRRNIIKNFDAEQKSFHEELSTLMRKYILQQKEGVQLAIDFINGTDWCVPQFLSGHDCECRNGSLLWHLNELNTAKKALNEDLKSLSE